MTERLADRTADRRGLGRGLGELFQRTEPTPAPAPEPVATAGRWEQRRSQRRARGRAGHPIPEGSYFAEIALESISPNPRQPRTVFDEDAMAELVESITEVGLLQPIVVRPLGD